MESHANVYINLLNREQGISMIPGGGGGCAVTCATHSGGLTTFSIAHPTSDPCQPTPPQPPRKLYPRNIPGLEIQRRHA